MGEAFDRFGAAVDVYEKWLAHQPLAVATKREYRRWVRAFAAWAAAAPEREEWGGDPLVDPLARDYAARDFKRWLQVERRLAPSSVNLGSRRWTASSRCWAWGSRACVASSCLKPRRARLIRPGSASCCGRPSARAPAIVP